MATLNQLKIGDIVYDLAAKFDVNDNNIQDTYSTKEYVALKISELVGSAPKTLDTLNELAEALGRDPNFATTIVTELNQKVDKIKGKQLSTEDFTTAFKTLLENLPNDVNSKYTKPTNGIPKSDLSESVLSSLNKADSAILDISSKLDVDTYEEDKTTYALKSEIPTTLPASDVSAWAKESTKPSYTAAEIGLSNVDNTADIDKPISTATLTVLNLLSANVQTLTLSVADIQGVEDLLSYGISFNSTVADPKCTRIGNPLLHKSLPIQSLYRGCVVKDGVLLYYLDPNDWSKKAGAGVIASDNGVNAGSGVNVDNLQEDSVLDGTDGEVCVETPKFYLKCTTVGNITTIRESLQQIDANYKEIPSMFVDAYRGTVNSSKLRSVVNTSAEFRGGTNNTSYDSYLESDPFKCLLGKPRTNITRANFRTYARNIGKELLSYDQYKAIFYWNYVIEYANFNSLADYNANLTSDGYRQGGLGAGLTTWDWTSWGTYNGNNPITPCGYGNDIGNFTGIKTIIVGSKTFLMPRWRGFDNPFGDIWTNVDGCVLKIPNMYILLNKENYTDSLDNIKYSRMYSTLPTTNGSIKSLQLGEYADMVPKTVGGNTTTYMCDYYWQNSNLNTLLVGGNVAYGSKAGLAGFYGGTSGGGTGADVGARGVFVKS